MRDGFGREVNYLRVSVTDRCNLRCRYCMPEQGVRPIAHADVLRYEEIERVVRVAARLGFWRVRVTGGEPLVRKGLAGFIARLASIPGIADISLTTNGILLADAAGDLRRAGLRRVNVSLDTLREDRFAWITRRPDFGRAWAGIMAALREGLVPVKVNVVLMAGFNDDEVEDFARLTREYPLWVRFIELMPLGDNGLHGESGYLPVASIWPRLKALGPLEEVPSSPTDGGGPARYFSYRGAPGRLGLITPLSQHFCGGCNRLRLTSDGRLTPCLAGVGEVDVRGPLRAGATDDDLARLIAVAVREKPQEHHMAPGQVACDRQMSRLGG
ncbi:MAG: GTP 3',8-cyclase MoaA [Firmicutes bacterium]|nr:GTP 3',8-cyclase MoaA [Bacillota bacterium]